MKKLSCFRLTALAMLALSSGLTATTYASVTPRSDDSTAILSTLKPLILLSSNRNSLNRAAVLTSQTPQYQTVTTNSTPIPGFYTEGWMTPCPLNPESYANNLSSDQLLATIAQTSANTDINGKMPTGSDTPYYQCYVRSRVMCGNSPCTDTSVSSQITSSQTVAAVCPDGYVQVGMFGMDREVAYRETPDTKYSPTDIPDKTVYDALVAKGYECTVPNDNMYLRSSCLSADTNERASYTFNYAVNTPYNLSQVTGGNDPGVIQFKILVKRDGGQGSLNACYALQTDCGTPTASCELVWSTSNVSYGATGTTGEFWINGGVYFAAYMYLSYGHVQCTIPAGAYFTGNYAPRGLICARLISKQANINR